MGVDNVKYGDRVATSDHKKAEVVSLVFFPAIPKMRNDCQRSIDIPWRTHRALRAIVRVGVIAHEVIAAVRRMRVGATPG